MYMDLFSVYFACTFTIHCNFWFRFQGEHAHFFIVFFVCVLLPMSYLYTFPFTLGSSRCLTKELIFQDAGTSSWIHFSFWRSEDIQPWSNVLKKTPDEYGTFNITSSVCLVPFDIVYMGSLHSTIKEPQIRVHKTLNVTRSLNVNTHELDKVWEKAAILDLWISPENTCRSTTSELFSS